MTDLFILEEQPRPEPVRWELALVRRVIRQRHVYNGLGQLNAGGQFGGSIEESIDTETKPVTVAHLREVFMLLTPEERAEVCRP